MQPAPADAAATLNPPRHDAVLQAALAGLGRRRRRAAVRVAGRVPVREKGRLAAGGQLSRADRRLRAHDRAPDSTSRRFGRGGEGIFRHGAPRIA